MSKESISERKLKRLKWSEIPGLFKDTFKAYMKGGTMQNSASLAYYTLFAMLPLMYLAIKYLGVFVGNEAVRDTIASVLKHQVGISDISGIMEFLKTIDIEQRNFIMEAIGIGALLFSCSAFIVSLKRSLNDFFGIQEPQLNRKKLFLHNILFRLFSIVIIAFFGIVIITLYLGETVLISMGASLFDNEVLKYFYSNFLEHATSILMSFLIFSAIFKYVHDGIVQWKLAMAGGLVTAVLLYVGQLLIKYYLTNYFFASEAGLAGTIFVLLAWVYYSAQIIFLGATFTAVYAKAVDRPIRMKFKTQEEIANSIL